MEFDSYIDWYNNLLTMPLNDVILGVKDTIEDKTVYLSLSDSKVLKMDNTSFVMGYYYQVVLSVKDVDDELVRLVGDVYERLEYDELVRKQPFCTIILEVFICLVVQVVNHGNEFT